MRLAAFAVVVGLAGLVVAGPAGATPRQRCAAAKIGAAMQYVRAISECQAVAARGGTDVDPACLARARARLLMAFDVAEREGRCATVGDAETIAEVIDFYVNALVPNLRTVADPSGPCPAARLVAAGMAAARGLRCAISPLLGPTR